MLSEILQKIFRRGTKQDNTAFVTIETPETTHFAEVTSVEVHTTTERGIDEYYEDEIILKTKSELKDVGWPK